MNRIELEIIKTEIFAITTQAYCVCEAKGFQVYDVATLVYNHLAWFV